MIKSEAVTECMSDLEEFFFFIGGVKSFVSCCPSHALREINSNGRLVSTVVRPLE